MTNEEAHVLELIFAHNKSHVQTFLADMGLPKSGTQEELYGRVLVLIKEKKVNLSDLTKLLDRIEGWGDQQIYLYKPLHKADRLIFSDKVAFEKLLKKMEIHKLLNNERSTILPETRTLSTIEYDNKYLKFIWIEERFWEERKEEKDKVVGGYVYKAYKSHSQRGIISFDLDITSGAAMLMIQKLPTNSVKDYLKIKSELEQELKAFINLAEIPPVHFKKCIKAIQKSGEVRSRQIEDKTNLGSRAKYTSSNRRVDVDKDVTIKRARNITSLNSQPFMGNFYWLPEESDEDLVSELHTVLYANDNRLGIYGERTQEEVRYIIKRIREFAQ